MVRIRRQYMVILVILVMLMVASVGTALAAVVVNERNQSFNFEINTCNGEIVKLPGTLHTVIQEQKNGTTQYHYNFHGTGIGDQGNSYVINFQENDTFTTSSFAISYREVLISKGSAPNQSLLITLTSSDLTVETVCH